MKKLFLTIVVLITVATVVSAQKGKMAVGGGLNYGSDIETIGIGARFHYNISDQLRLAPNATYYFPNNDVTLWDISADVHYLFPIQEKLTLYPIGGLALTGSSFDTNGAYDDLDVDTSKTAFGLNLGGGAQYDLTSNLSLFSELKYTISDLDQLVFSTGITYSF